jgi:hypothetical protein
MHGHALAALVVVMFCGLLRPLGWRVRALVRAAGPASSDTKPPPDVMPDRGQPLPMRLNAIELALIAEHSREMARANEAVADDTSKRLETRRRASDVAAAWRQRAQLFQMQAQRESARPIVPGEQTVCAFGRKYTGPERRERGRRTQTRRTDGSSVGTRHARGDRRARPERRGRDRRRPQPAPR